MSMHNRTAGLERQLPSAVFAAVFGYLAMSDRASATVASRYVHSVEVRPDASPSCVRVGAATNAATMSRVARMGPRLQVLEDVRCRRNNDGAMSDLQLDARILAVTGLTRLAVSFVVDPVQCASRTSLRALRVQLPPANVSELKVDMAAFAMLTDLQLPSAHPLDEEVRLPPQLVRFRGRLARLGNRFTGGAALPVSLTSLEMRHGYVLDMDLLTKALPRLQHLECLFYETQLTLPYPSLASIKTRVYSNEDACLQFMRRLPSLRALTLSLDDRAVTDVFDSYAVEEIMRELASYTQLASLRIRFCTRIMHIIDLIAFSPKLDDALGATSLETTSSSLVAFELHGLYRYAKNIGRLHTLPHCIVKTKPPP